MFQHCDNVAHLASEAGVAYGLKHLACLAGRMHDTGKSTLEFARYIRAAADGKAVVRGSVTHSVQGAMIVHSLVSDKKEGTLLTDELIRCAILSHHGLRDCITHEGAFIYKDAAERELSSFSTIKPLVEEEYGTTTLKQEFADAVRETEVIRTKLLAYMRKHAAKCGSHHFMLSMYVRLLTSIVIDADRTDTACFMDQLPFPIQPLREQRIAQWSDLLNHFEQKLQAFRKDKPPSSLDRYRMEISDACKRFDGGEAGVFRLVVPCGARKTLASLRYALHTAKRYGKKHIFYISPYCSILEQNAAEIRAYVGNDDAVLEHHSNVLFEGEDASEKEKTYSLLTENWNQSPIIATTAVQLLNTLFSSKTASVRRMGALGDSILIIDEIQTLPPKVLKLFNGTMNFLSEFCNTNVVLCSATQPPLDLLDSYQIFPPIAMITDENTYDDVFQRADIINSTTSTGFTFIETADFILSKSCDVRSVLAIVNTKRCAREVFRLLDERIHADGNRDQYSLFHLSTNMCPVHRTKVLAQLRACLGDKQYPKKIICISTNLIEAGVDLSYDCVVRSLAGLDSIVQAAGRCNRHREVEIGFVHVVNINEENVNFLGHLKQAQQATDESFHLLKSHPECYPGGALSASGLHSYYTLYYKPPLLKEMTYPLPYDPEHSIIDLLTTNKTAAKRLHERSNVTPPLLKQAFKEAGDAFSVIDDKYAKHPIRWLMRSGSTTIQYLILHVRWLGGLIGRKNNETYRKERY